MKKICLISGLLSRYFNDGIIPGGSELQTLLLAKLFQEKKFDVTIITFGNREETYTKEGLKVYCINIAGKKIPFIHIFYDLIPNLNKMLKLVDSDIYFQRGAGLISGVIAKYCMNYKKKFIFASSSTNNTNYKFIKETNFRDAYFYKYGLRNASKIVVQSFEQQEQLLKYHSLKSTIIKNILPFEVIENNDTKRDFILWVGSIGRVKQPEYLFDIAKALKNLKIVVIGGSRGDDEYFSYIINSFKKFQNIEYVGRKNRQELKEYYPKGIALINTSEREGFSNTWLEAWAHKVPVISLNVNPDNLLTKNKMGFHSKSISKMIEDIDLIQKSTEIRNELGKNGLRYVQENHKPEIIFHKYLDLFNS